MLKTFGPLNDGDSVPAIPNHLFRTIRVTNEGATAGSLDIEGESIHISAESESILPLIDINNQLITINGMSDVYIELWEEARR